MHLTRFVLAAVVASFLGCAAWADSPPSASAPSPQAGHGMTMHGMFTQEERMMLFSDMYKAAEGMTDDQKQDYRRQQRARIMGMSDDDRTKLKADLDARWNALSDDQKAAMTAKMQAFMAARRGGNGQ